MITILRLQYCTEVDRLPVYLQLIDISKNACAEWHCHYCGNVTLIGSKTQLTQPSQHLCQNLTTAWLTELIKYEGSENEDA